MFINKINIENMLKNVDLRILMFFVHFGIIYYFISINLLLNQNNASPIC